MKTILSAILAIAFYSSSGFAAGTKITCDFSKTGNFKGVKTMVLNSGNPGSVDIQFTNGTSETLTPQESIGGIFDQIHFSSSVTDKNDSRSFTFLDLDTSNSPFQNIQVAYACNQAFTTYCVGFSGDSTPIARVSINMDGTVLKFNGRNLPYCSRQ